MAQNRGLLVAVGAIVALLLITVATADGVPLADRAPTIPINLPELEPPELTPATLPPPEEPSELEPSEPSPGWMLFSDVLRYLFLALGVAGVVALMKKAWQHRPRLVWRKRERQPEFEMLDTVAEAMIADAPAQRAALRTGAARNAIVACWLRLERLVADTGLEPDLADTAEEFTTRVLSGYDVDFNAIHELAALYREARFSTHDMNEAHRLRAIGALDAIHASLRRREPHEMVNR